MLSSEASRDFLALESCQEGIRFVRLGIFGRKGCVDVERSPDVCHDRPILVGCSSASV
jgi:hypothetical protein